MKKMLMGVLIAGTAVGLLFAGSTKPKKAEILPEGHYTARLKPFICSVCPAVIQKTMEETKGVESVSLKDTTVQFAVKEGATVKLEDLQKNLKAAADKMGMGADYTLSEITPIKKAG